MPQNKKTGLIELNVGLGGAKMGSHLGSDALKNVALENKSEFFNVFKSSLKLSLNSPTNQALNSICGIKHIETLIPFYKKNIDTIQKSISNNASLLILSGDHSNAILSLSALKKEYPKKRIGIIWIDAHADLHNPFTSPSGNLHGMSLGVFFNSNLNNKNFQNTNAVKKQWKTLTQLCDPKNEGAFLAEDLIYIGLRSVEKEEQQQINSQQIFCLSVEEFRKKNIAIIIQNIQKKLNHCDMVYISFDIDVLDAKLVQGTGTPVKKGFQKEEINALLKNLIEKLPVKILEVTEINPLLDNKNKTAKLIFSVLENVVKSF